MTVSLFLVVSAIAMFVCMSVAELTIRQYGAVMPGLRARRLRLLIVLGWIWAVAMLPLAWLLRSS